MCFKYADSELPTIGLLKVWPRITKSICMGFRSHLFMQSACLSDSCQDPLKCLWAFWPIELVWIEYPHNLGQGNWHSRYQPSGLQSPGAWIKMSSRILNPNGCESGKELAASETDHVETCFMLKALIKGGQGPRRVKYPCREWLDNVISQLLID